jgi:hypothetical protein
MKAIPMEVTDDRKTTIEIEGEQYDLVFNARAAREVSAKYGSLNGFGDAIEKADDVERIDHNVWLTTLLVNQGVAIYNRHNPDDQRKLFTEDDIELLTRPADWQAARDALVKGSKRNIESETEPSKNADVE